MRVSLGWGHVNINVSDLDVAIAFYAKLGFSVFIPAIPYLNMQAKVPADIAATEALGLSTRTRGRACIMQLDDGFPKLDLTELVDVETRAPLRNQDVGVVRICLSCENLEQDYATLSELGVPFLTPPQDCPERLARIAVCQDPDGTLIELIQINLENWGPYLSG
ncbi:MAG: VOC family protein [Pseudomonadota bacterium]